MTLNFEPKGICAKQMTVTVDDGIITDVQIEGGCEGNRKGIIALIVGMPAGEAEKKLSGIKCGNKDTSCPDQLAKILRKMIFLAA